jgi:hypothetical protein
MSWFPSSLSMAQVPVLSKRIINEVEQITKADRDASHALCKKAKPAPRYSGLVPPFYGLNDS